MAKLNPLDVIGSSLGFVGNIANMIQGNKNIKKQIAAQKEENALNRAWNEKQAAQANRWSIEQWNRENEYNTPAAQMARMKAGGLNPDLMYGSAGSTGNLAAASPGVTPTSPSSPTDTSNLAHQQTFGSAVMSAGNMAMQYRMMNAQADKLDAEAEKTKADTTGQNTQNSFMPQLLAAALNKNTAEIDKLTSETGVNKERIYEIAQNVQESITRIRGIESEIENKSVQQAQNWFRLNLQRDMNEAQIKKLASATDLDRTTINKIRTLMPYEIQNLVSSTALQDSEAGVHFVEQGLKSLEQISTRIKNQQLSVLVDQARVEYSRTKQTDTSYRGKDGNYSALGKAIFLLQDMVKGSIGSLFK